MNLSNWAEVLREITTPLRLVGLAILIVFGGFLVATKRVSPRQKLTAFIVLVIALFLLISVPLPGDSEAVSGNCNVVMRGLWFIGFFQISQNCQ